MVDAPGNFRTKCIKDISGVVITDCIARSNEILGWAGVEHRQLLCFFTAWIN
jgi:hypothetical protein